MVPPAFLQFSCSLFSNPSTSRKGKGAEVDADLAGKLEERWKFDPDSNEAGSSGAGESEGRTIVDDFDHK